MKISSLSRKLRLAAIALASVALAGSPAPVLAARDLPTEEFVEPSADPQDDVPTDDEEVTSDETAAEDGGAEATDDQDDTWDDEEGDIGGFEDIGDCGDPGDGLENPDVIFYNMAGHRGDGPRLFLSRPHAALDAHKARFALKGTGVRLKTVHWKVVGRDRHFHAGAVNAGKWVAAVTNLRPGKNRVVVFGVTELGVRTERVTVFITRK